jgi:acyl carrier protein
MNEFEIRSAVAEVLEVDPGELQTGTELESFPTYDSTARLSLMICLSDAAGRPIELCALQDLRTYGDILSLVEKTAA